MTNTAAVETIREHGLRFLGIVEDRTAPRAVRAFACDVVWSALVYAKDERMLAAILGAVGRAVDADDEPPLLLLRSLNIAFEFDRVVAAEIMRLGERAYDLGHITALARVTSSVRLRSGAYPGAPTAPAHWVRRLVGTSTPEDARPEVLSAVDAWLTDERTDVEEVSDVIPNPQAWIDLALARM